MAQDISRQTGEQRLWVTRAAAADRSVIASVIASPPSEHIRHRFGYRP
jgi:hypothetical protein